MLDWSLAERVADVVAGTDLPTGGAPRAGDGPPAELPADLEARAARALEAVVAYAHLEPQRPLPPIEPVDRKAWARANLATMRSTLAPLLERMDRRTGTLAGPLRAAGGAVMAVEVGGLVGLMGRRVLGQYELALLDVQAPVRLLLVAPNLRDAARELDVDLSELTTWVVVHEVTHAVQFTAVDWLQDHLGGMLRELLSSVDVSIDPSALLRMPSREDLAGLWDSLRDGGLVTAVAGPERRALIDRVQATMALVEGHAEHVMDAAGAPLLQDLPSLRTALDRRRRERPPIMRLLERLLGLDLKLRQYEVGRRFCDGVVQRGGVTALNRAWARPELLPTLAELDDPAAWMRRTTVRSITSANG
jgi:coenzyme F420 biosynthesis associated uncharacterized protein